MKMAIHAIHTSICFFADPAGRSYRWQDSQVVEKERHSLNSNLPSSANLQTLINLYLHVFQSPPTIQMNNATESPNIR